MLNKKEIQKISDIAVEGARAALKAAGYDYDMVYKGGKYNEAGLEMKVAVEFMERDEVCKRDFGHYAKFFGLKEEDHGLVFTNNGSKFKLHSIKMANRKFPILAKKLDDGQIYKFPESIVNLIQLTKAGAVGS